VVACGALSIGSKIDIAPNSLGRYATDKAGLVWTCGRGAPYKISPAEQTFLSPECNAWYRRAKVMRCSSL